MLQSIYSVHFQKTFNLSNAQSIGRGNYARVLRLNQPLLRLALRIVDKSHLTSEQVAQEHDITRKLSKINCDNILRIYQTIDLEHCLCFLMEECVGGSLWDALNQCKQNRMGQADAMGLTLQLTHGIQELHRQGITHRDLKPQNILLKTPYVLGQGLPTVKLADFGLSADKVIMETVAGTKEYIAPEQIKNRNYTNAVDVWSLGIILDQMLHGTPFYCGADNNEVFQKIIKDKYVVRDQTIRDSIKILLQTLLNKKPYDRPLVKNILTNIQDIIGEISREAISSQSKEIGKKQKVMRFQRSAANKDVVQSKSPEKQKKKVHPCSAAKNESPVQKNKSPSQKQLLFKKDTKVAGVISQSTSRVPSPQRKVQFRLKRIETLPSFFQLDQYKPLYLTERQRNLGSHKRILVSVEQFLVTSEKSKQRSFEFKLNKEQKFLPSMLLKQAPFEQICKMEIDPLRPLAKIKEIAECPLQTREQEQRLYVVEKSIRLEGIKCRKKIQRHNQLILAELWSQMDFIVDMYLDKCLS